MTSTLAQLKQRSDSDRKAAREAYIGLLSKPIAGNKALTKLDADKLHALCQQLGITPEQAAEDETTLRRVAELTEAGKGWDARMKDLKDEQNALAPQWSPNAETEAVLKLRREFGEGRDRLHNLS